jgi:hypothetical protein
MRWKEILIGAISTLIVTIVGGIIVYVLTVQKPKEHNEKLVFAIESPVTFQSEKTTMGLATIRVANQGDVAASDVKINIAFNSDLIKDKKVALSSGDTTGYRVSQDTPRLLSLVVPSLVPNETVQTTLLLATDIAIKPNVTVRSTKTLGEEAPLIARTESPPSKTFAGTVIAVSTGMLGATLMLILMRRLVRGGVSRGSSFNNIAFVLLHRGLVDRATDLLNRAVTAGADAPHSLANYALCLATANEFDAADDYLNAADFYASTMHEKAVV